MSLIAIKKQIVKPILLALFLAANCAHAVDLPGFKDGPVIKGYGKHANVTGAEFTARDVFRVAFDVAAGADAGEVNRRFDSLARFINMHVAAGADKDNIQLALVVHGKASIDLLQSAVYRRVHSEDNANIALLKLLMQNNVDVILCGQSAAAYEISPSQLINGVKVELSAMTAHARLQQDGYTLNPF